VSAANRTGDQVIGDEYLALPDPVSERLFGLIMALTAEVWTLRDRLRLAEGALAEQGIELAELIDDRRDREDELAAMRADRDAFVARVLRPVSGRPSAPR
jgi:hypothetical protein